MRSMSLPPHLSEVAFLSTELPSGFDKLLSDTIRSYGRLVTQQPVAISDIQDRPGALQVSWAEVKLDTTSLINNKKCCGIVRIITFD